MATIKLTVPGKQIVGVTDWETPGETPVWGPQKPASTRERHSWNNDTSVNPLGVSPFDQNKQYIVEKKSRDPVTFNAKGEPVYGITRAYMKGSDLVSPGVGDNGPGQKQATVKIEEVSFLEAIYEAVQVEVEVEVEFP